MNKHIGRVIITITTSLMLCSFYCFFTSVNSVKADYSSRKPKAKSYELNDASSYDRTGRSTTDKFAFGRESIGTIHVDSSFSQEVTYKSRQAFGVYEGIKVGYAYDGSLQTNVKEDWNIVSDDSTKVNGYAIPKSGLIQPKVGSGIVIIQKSDDGFNWDDTTAPLTDFFKKNKEGKEELLSATEDEIKNGQFYRVTIAYRIGRKTGEKDVTGWFNTTHKEDVYEYRQCLEIYEFYICSDKKYVEEKDLVTREEIHDSEKSEKGFYICKNGSDNVVTVSKKSNDSDADDFQSFTEIGNYTVTVTTKLGSIYRDDIYVSDGLSVKNINPFVYETERNKGFPEEGLVNGNTSFGQTSLTELCIGYREGTDITSTMKGNVTGYGISGDTVNLFLKVKSDVDSIGEGWSVTYDKWGKNEKEKISGVQTGTIGKGALIVQTSPDGENWVNIDNGRYANGLYTTDFGTYYSSGENVFIYSPDGQSVTKGVYLRVYYAYQAFHSETKTYRDCLEKYEFYLCSNELNAVTFHNLTVKDLLETNTGNIYESTAAMNRKAETMLSGAMTVTGFSIDTSLNPTATYSIERDGKEIAVSQDNKYTETGKYIISIKSAVGDERTVTLYVDNRTPEEAMTKYFGSSFIEGKRIYTEGKYPAFEAGETKYNLETIKDNSLPVSGYILNIKNGKKTTINAWRDGDQFELNEAGEYEAVFTTETNEEGKKSGDSWKFVFHFVLIAHGDAPGPVVNQKSLSEYGKKSVSDYFPVYYGLTYSSADRGYITLAFSNYDDALKYAYSYESGTVEKQDDGSYRYNGSFLISQKTKFESNWDLNDAINYFAEMAVQRLYFNLDDKYTYLTLEDSVAKNSENLRKLELSKSVVVFADDTQKYKLTENSSSCPIINDKRNVYLVPGTSGTVKEITNTFEFVKDKYGCDSNSVEIVDAYGRVYKIDYNRSVEQQLKKQNCPSGMITINEKTFYGDTVSYNAIYIAEGDNKANLSIQLGNDGNGAAEEFGIKDNGKVLDSESFSIKSFRDDLDPCSLVIVSNGHDEDFYTANSQIEKVWATPGEYTITCVNRMGYAFSLRIKVKESEKVYISFDGEGSSGLKTISAMKGDKNISLPTPIRDGYEFVGYIDDKTGKTYKNQIDEVDSVGTLTLTAQWKRIKPNVTNTPDSTEQYANIDLPSNSGLVGKAILKVVLIVFVLFNLLSISIVLAVILIVKNKKTTNITRIISEDMTKESFEDSDEKEAGDVNEEDN